ncbi:KPN_02809 family neutral zinc metallopeptidase [Leisingera sp. ANG-M7]|uniref:KPN_02809 family neutral zinc metallopeptidase n=1 Tax=Leisingera sp. ANG-M7 TaxID=1577902 RepID=UPI00057F36E8|nr:neutral zinc metallopeptidase [Leisingera sp. ANG-M7]KIC37468.1 membrane protein [Leisingera sp. ANG-M7]
MRWRGRRQSRNIEDRRGRRISGKGAGIGGAGLLLIVVAGAFFGVDLTPLLRDSAPQSSANAPVTAADQEAAEFVSVALADTEVVWTSIFEQQLGRRYNPVVLVLYKGVTQSPCGGANGATGPFYCPMDEKVYLDTSFFTTLSQRLGARGDFAAAYVVAHEVAHHVQNELGILGETQRVRARVSEVESNAISVRTELQADCFSGIWARYAQDALGTLDPGDVEEAMNAAKQIGDDTLQRNAGRVPQPHTFSHGTSAQRQDWFARGFQTGEVKACDTFSASSL